jgi:hypothetical protein
MLYTVFELNKNLAPEGPLFVQKKKKKKDMPYIFHFLQEIGVLMASWNETCQGLICGDFLLLIS